VWFAYRLGPGVYGAFAAANAGLFVRPPSFEIVDIVEARQAEARA
jgi:hypothetical protein